MLRTLDITDMLLIDRLELDLRPGLNVLTGETGAGKSILLDMLGFVLGWRGRAELVRSGAAQGEVTAVFDLDDAHPARAVLDEAGIAGGGSELILRRVNTSDGRKTAWVNDRRVSGEILRRLSETLVEVHGQHDDRGLLNPRGHRSVLDAFAGHDDLREAVRLAWRARAVAKKALAEAEEEVAAARAEEEFLRHSVKELDALSPIVGDESALDADRRMMRAAGSIREDVEKASASLGPEGAEGRLSDAKRWLEGVEADAGAEVGAPVAALGRALAELGEAQDGVARLLDKLEVDPQALERIEERLFELRGLARKHGVASDELAALAEEMRGKLARLDDTSGGLAALSAAVDGADATFAAAARKLSASRREAASRLDAEMAGELAPLKMDRAVFTTEVSEADASPDGVDAVAFTVVTTPGTPPGPLNRIASGGELSRFMLALKVCLRRENAGITMIFDEIDRGVGGATADAVGRRLSSLASDGQVLVVTHSPQVAALGDHHMRVEKRVSEDTALSSVVALTDVKRVDEIARMISGDRVTDAAKEAAGALIAGSGRAAGKKK